MRIEIKGATILTPALKEYIVKKFQQISRFVKRNEEQEGEKVLFVEVAKTTKHHKKGPIFYAEATLRLAKNVLRAESVGSDMQSALDQLKDVFKREVLRHKERADTRKKR
ncbi:MAG: ribosome-associated translation inhibitor RaiA [bacterium]|nr:ribosome-associated translation inhibitor RaiA [bacterium]